MSNVRLSTLQQHILRWCHTAAPDWAGMAKWTPHLTHPQWRAASVSRAVRRLEQRGLVETCSQVSETSHQRTHIGLTEAGRVVAQTLTESGQDINKRKYVGRLRDRRGRRRVVKQAWIRLSLYRDPVRMAAVLAEHYTDHDLVQMAAALVEIAERGYE